MCKVFLIIYTWTKKEINISHHTKKHTEKLYLSSHGDLLYIEKIIFHNSMPIKDRINHIKIYNNPLLFSWFRTMKILKWLSVTLI